MCALAGNHFAPIGWQNAGDVVSRHVASYGMPHAGFSEGDAGMEKNERNRDDLGKNLKLLSGRYRSIALLCKRMEINRQQFNKYLSGTSRPSLYTLNRMADFFGVDETELLLPHAQFVRDVFSRANSDISAPVGAFFARKRAVHAEGQKKLSQYVGCYYLYFRSPAWPGGLIKSFMVLSQYQDATYARTVERLVRVNKPHLGCFVQKYCSLVLFEADRIFMIEGQPRDTGSLAMITLYPNSRARIGFLHGLQLSVTSASGQRPYACRIMLEYLGKQPNLRQMMRSCGVYPVGSEQIDPEIWRDTANEITEADASLTARMV